MLATTDDPCDPLEHHAALADDPSWSGRVIPTFRPDLYLEPGRSDFGALLADLAVAADVDTGSHRGHVEALAARRRKIAEDKIAAAELAAVAELRAKAADAAAIAARGLIAENHSASADKALVDQAIAAI